MVYAPRILDTLLQRGVHTMSRIHPTACHSAWISASLLSLCALASPAVGAGVDPDDALLDGSQAVGERSAGTADSAATGGGMSVREIDLYASDKAARLQLQLNRPSATPKGSWSSVGFLFNEGRDNLLTGTLVVDASPTRWQDITVGVGLRGFGAILALENSDVFGLGAGFEVGLGADFEGLPVRADAAVYYAPDIFTFGQSDRIIDLQYDVSVGVRPTFDVYLGGRFLQFDTRPGDRELDKRVHLGFRWRFED